MWNPLSESLSLKNAKHTNLKFIPFIRLGDNAEQHGKDPRRPRDRPRVRVSVPLDQVAHQRKLEVVPEGQADGVVQRLEVPLQRVSRGQHDRFQRFSVEYILK